MMGWIAQIKPCKSPDTFTHIPTSLFLLNGAPYLTYLLAKLLKFIGPKCIDITFHWLFILPWERSKARTTIQTLKKLTLINVFRDLFYTSQIPGVR